MRLAKGFYFGENVRQTRCPTVWFTLTRYAPLSEHELHVHEDPGLFAVLSGQYSESRDSGSLDQEPFTVVLHEDRFPHESRIGPAGALGLNISFNREWFRSEGVSLSGFGMDLPLIRAQILRLVAYLGSNDICGSENAALELVGMCATLRPGRLSRANLVSARCQLEGAFAQPLSFSDLASSLGVHPAYLSRSFREEFGCSMSEHLTVLRLGEAVRLILEGRKMGEAAVQAGFYDQPQFCRAFRATLGSKPGSLRSLGKEALVAAGSSP